MEILQKNVYFSKKLFLLWNRCTQGNPQEQEENNIYISSNNSENYPIISIKQAK